MAFAKYRAVAALHGTLAKVNDNNNLDLS